MDATKVKSQPPTNSLTNTARTQATQQAQKRTAENQHAQQAQQTTAKKSEPQQPRPNVNGQGKMIGTRLSVTA